MPTAITLADVSTEVKGGDTVTLNATVAPVNASDKTVVWSSSDTSVATVDANGKVTFANVSGTKTVTITAAAKADATVKATVDFNVEELVIDVPVTGVTISEETLELTKGDTADLTVAVTPEDASLKTVTWESADEDVATVDSDGHVTATGVGTTTITVKTVDGAKTAVCEITVNAPKATAVSVSVDETAIDKLDMTVGDTATLTAKAEPDDAVQSFTFESSDEAVVTVDANGKLTAVAAGTAKITIAADGAKAEIEVTVEVKKDGSLDVEAKGEFTPSIEMSKEDVVSAIKNVLSEEQLAAIDAGTAKVEVELSVTNIDATVSEADKELVAAAIESIADGGKLGYQVMNYLDIKFGATVDGEVIAISETDGLITVSVALEKAVNGTYKVIRIHDGKAEVIDSELSADGTRLTFKTDKFSTYAIVFADVAMGDSAPIAPIAFLMLIAAVIAAAAVTVRRTAKQR
ncbi:MAG: Ig-like domain-containing protein [Butyrivibrio sp.]|nr:Ig-like domain-containing protein [Butyrivibrio sp.]